MWINMKELFFLLVFMWLVNPASGQHQKSRQEFRPFSILIVSPDSIEVHESLKPLIDTVESDFRKAYYDVLRELEQVKEFKSEKEREEIRMTIQRAKWMEIDIHNSRLRNFIPMLTCSELSEIFNAGGRAEFSFEVIDRDEMFSYENKTIVDYYDVDYLLRYKSITMPLKNGEPVLKIAMQLFARKENRLIFEGIVFGYARFYRDNSGILRACPNDLQCMIDSGVISSAAKLFDVIRRRR